MATSTNKFPRKISNFREKLKNAKRFLPLIALVLTVVVVIGLVGYGVTRAFANKSDSRVVIPEARASQTIDKQLEFPILDEKGEEVTRLKFKIDNVELRDEIIVKGHRVTSVKGRTFLIVSMSITNDYDKAMEMKVADYVRLSTNGNEIQLLAPEIHSDPVLVQSISTKMTRVGFPINDTDTSLVLFVGEVKGAKERIEISF